MLNILYIKGNRILLNQYLLRKMLFCFAKFINQSETNEKNYKSYEFAEADINTCIAMRKEQ